MRTPTSKDRIVAHLRGVSVAQHIFDEWIEEIKRSGDNFEMLDHPIKLSWWKCWLWPFLPELVLGDDPLRFKDWSIGHCLNCDADRYNGKVVAWSYDQNWYRGALIKCGKCGCLRWQFGDSGTDY